jgi:hypothetical protein
MKFLRLRLWMVMALVALVAMATQAIRLGQLRIECLQLARHHANNEQVYASMPSKIQFSPIATASERERVFDDLRVQESYHAQLKRKYSRVAARPWLTIEPDPPFPSHASDPGDQPYVEPR